MKKTIKIYEEQGLKYYFDSTELSVLINLRKHALSLSNKKATKGNVMEELATQTCVSTEAIKNWMYGYNGPSDLEQVKKISEYFKVDYHQLLKKEAAKMENYSSNYTDTTAQAVYTKDKIREIYVAIVEFIDDAEYVFYDLAYAFPDNTSNKEFMDIVGEKRGELKASLTTIKDLVRDNMLDIPEAFYEKLDNYCWSTLDNLITAITDYYIYTNEDGDEILEFADVLGNYDAYFEYREYLKELRALFQDYIVK